MRTASVAVDPVRKLTASYGITNLLILRFISYICAGVIIKPIIALSTLLMLGTVMAGANQLLEQLRLDHSALVAAESDFRVHRARGSLIGAEAADYATYIARLVKRVAESCVELARTGSPLPADVKCPTSPFPVIQAAPIDQRAEQTRAEQIATLDAELNTGLWKFDELLLREQERVRAAAPRSADANAGKADGSSTGGTIAGGGDAQSTRVGDAETERTTGGGAGEPTRSASKKGRPPGMPVGSDDDVVARQLREAAEKETDPELRKKLWEEYKKYKRGTR